MKLADLETEFNKGSCILPFTPMEECNRTMHIRYNYLVYTNSVNISVQVTMSYLQIYQEKIYDLLNSTNKVELSLREHPIKGMHLFAAGMCKYFLCWVFCVLGAAFVLHAQYSVLRQCVFYVASVLYAL